MKRKAYILFGCAVSVMAAAMGGCGQSKKEEAVKTEQSTTLPEETDPETETVPQANKESADRSLYRQNADNTPAVGWVTDPDGTKGYCGEDGYLLTGFHDIEGARYLFTEEGDMVTGPYTLEDGERILFTEDGKQFLQSVAPMDGYLYYFDENGRIVKGREITFLDGTTGMADEEGHLYTGCHRIGNEVYTFTSLGRFRHKIDATKPMVALTYDDGPSTKNTQVILDTLKANNAYATFFVLGRNVNRCADLIQAIEDSGCEIGNHTYNHYMIVNMDAQVTDQEISSTSSYVQMITNNRPAIMRPPTGATNEVSCANVAAVDDGYPIILWSLDTVDWQHKDAATTCERIRSQVRDGSIVLMHDMEESSAAASQTIIPELIGMGYQLVSVSELAAARGGMVPGEIYNHFYPEDVPAATEAPQSEENPDTEEMPSQEAPPLASEEETKAQAPSPQEENGNELEIVFPWA